MDLTAAIEIAQILNATYAVAPTNLANAAGSSITAGGTTYTVVTTIYASDLATDMNPARAAFLVSIGLVLQAPGTGAVVIAVRGTQGILEWIHDAEFFLVPCPILPGSGHTEDGFTDMYRTLRASVSPGSPGLVAAMSSLAFPHPVGPVTVCGHSLGGALATLLAMDLAANSAFKNPTVFTYASPRTGDPAFVSTYNQVVPNTFRIANRADLVPKLPFPPFYDHVRQSFDLNAVQLIPPRTLVKPTIPCEHALDSYLHLLSVLAGGPVIPLDAECVP